MACLRRIRDCLSQLSSFLVRSFFFPSLVGNSLFSFLPLGLNIHLTHIALKRARNGHQSYFMGEIRLGQRIENGRLDIEFPRLIGCSSGQNKGSSDFSFPTISTTSLGWRTALQDPGTTGTGKQPATWRHNDEQHPHGSPNISTVEFVLCTVALRQLSPNPVVMGGMNGWEARPGDLR